MVSPEGNPAVREGLLARFAKIGSLPTDTPEEALRKEVLLFSSGLMSTLAVIWVATYWALGITVAALIPLVYQLVSILSLLVYARSRRYRVFRACQLSLSLVLPLLLQLSLGGFAASSGVVLWSFSAPLGALLFAGRRQAVPWFIAFMAVLVVAGILDPLLPAGAQIPREIVVLFSVLNVAGVTGTSYVLLQYFVRERERYAAALAAEQERSERLLLNVLPEPIAQRLKSGEFPIADATAEVGVLFADIVEFTPLAESMQPDDVVRLLDRIFTAFDALTAKYRLEKIKTVGDAYMVASGLLEPKPDHVEDIATMALAMQQEISSRTDGSPISLRIGIDIGPVIAGVIGESRFIFDLWGDTVNTASRMESHGLPGCIQVTERAYLCLKDKFHFEPRGELDIKGKGPMRTYFLLRSREAPGGHHGTPDSST